MSVKQDRTYTRTASELERKYNFGQKFSEILGIAEDAQSAANQAAEAVQTLDKDLTPDEIFNRLTGNSREQGIYRENGKIYINANFIQTGYISSDIIKAGVIRSTDYEVVEVDMIYPGEIYPGYSMYPNYGDDIQRGIEIDFAAGVIRGAFMYDVTDDLDRRVKALEAAVFNS